LAWLNDEGLWTVLGFLIPVLAELPAVAAADRRLGKAVCTPGSWNGSTVCVARAAVEKYGAQVARLGALCWGPADEVRLAACPSRPPLHTHLQQVWPGLKISVGAEGPTMLFIMWADIVHGKVIELSCFEPRYRWMCRRLLDPSTPLSARTIGFVTHGFLTRARTGACGYLCEVLGVTGQRSGDFSCRLRIGPFFKVAEAWTEEVPSSPEAAQLHVGYLDLLPEKQWPSSESMRRVELDAEQALSDEEGEEEDRTRRRQPLPVRPAGLDVRGWFR